MPCQSGIGLEKERPPDRSVCPEICDCNRHPGMIVRVFGCLVSGSAVLL